MELLQSVFVTLGAATGCVLAWALLRNKRVYAKWLKGSARKRRMESHGRLVLAPQHSLHLVEVEGRWLCLAVSPKGIEVLESGAYVGNFDANDARIEKVESDLLSPKAFGQGGSR